jgi:hypothetical protein
MEQQGIIADHPILERACVCQPQRTQEEHEELWAQADAALTRLRALLSHVTPKDDLERQCHKLLDAARLAGLDHDDCDFVESLLFDVVVKHNDGRAAKNIPLVLGVVERIIGDAA